MISYMKITTLTVKDEKILAELDLNARQSNAEIGKKVGLSKETVAYRIELLRKKGIIVRFHTLTNYFKLGYMKFKLYMRLNNTSNKNISAMANYFTNNPANEWVVHTTGKWDLIVGFIVKDVNQSVIRAPGIGAVIRYGSRSGYAIIRMNRRGGNRHRDTRECRDGTSEKEQQY